MYLPLGHNKVCNVYTKTKLSASMYLPLGHNKVCNVQNKVYQNKVKCFNVPPLGA